MPIGTYFVVAFALALAIVPACRALAIGLGYIAAPKADRWHTRRTALLGGVAIALVTLAGGLTLRPFSQVSLFVVSGAAIFVVGLVDDVISLKPATKLVAQIGLAALFVFYGYRLHWVQSMTLDTMLTLGWLVGVTNAF